MTLDSLRRRGADLPANVLEHLDTTSTHTAPAPRCRILKGRRDDVTDIMDLCRVMEVSPLSFYHKLIRYSRHSLPTEYRLPEDSARLRSLPVEPMTNLEVPVPAFQETEVYDIHGARCTGNRLFRNQGSRKDWFWVQARGEGRYGALRGHLPAKLLALLKIRDYISEGGVRGLTSLQMLSPVNAGHPSDVHGLVIVHLREEAPEFMIVDIGTILGLAHLIPEADRRSLVKSQIDLRTFNEIY